MTPTELAAQRVSAQRDALLAAVRAVLVAWHAGDWSERGATSRFRATLMALDDVETAVSESSGPRTVRTVRELVEHLPVLHDPVISAAMAALERGEV